MRRREESAAKLAGPVDALVMGKSALSRLSSALRPLEEVLSRAVDRIELLHRLYPYFERQLAAGVPLSRMVRHVIGLFNGEPNAKRWRRFLSEYACRRDAGMEILYRAERQKSRYYKEEHPPSP